MKRAEREVADRRRDDQIKRHTQQLEQQREVRRAEWERRRSTESVNQITPPADGELNSLIGILRTLATISACVSIFFFMLTAMGIIIFPLLACAIPALAFATYWLILTIGAKVLTLLGSIAQGIERIDRKLDADPSEDISDQDV